MKELLSKEERVLLFDLMADPKFQNWGIAVDNYRDAYRLAAKTKKFHIRLQTDKVEEFDFLCRLLVKKPHGEEVFPNTLIAVDEISMFCSPYYMPQSFKDLIRLGRHTGAKFMGTTQRPPDIHSLILSQAKEWYIFQMHLPRDLETLKKFVPDIERARNLKTGEFILWTPTTQTANETD